MNVVFFMGALNWLNAWFGMEGRLKGEDIVEYFVAPLRNGIKGPHKRESLWEKFIRQQRQLLAVFAKMG